MARAALRGALEVEGVTSSSLSRSATSFRCALTTWGVKDSTGELVPQLSVADVKKHLAEGTILGGMIPKVECCISALEGGVNRTHIVDGRILHAILLEIFTDSGVGTLITH